MKYRLICVCLVYVLISPSHINSQNSINDAVINYVKEYSSGYVKPLVDAVSENVATGWSNFTPLENKMFNFDIGVHSTFMIVNKDQRVFKIRSPYDGLTQEVPTILGDATQVPISRTNINPLVKITPEHYLAGYDYTTVPLFEPQISMGNILGTRLMLRFMPKVKVFDFAYISSYGIGLQHSISRYFRNFPVGISVTASYQKVILADIAASNSYLFSIQAFKIFPFISFYSDIGYKYTKVTFDYTAHYTNPSNPNETISQRINFDINGRNGLKVSGGASLNFYILKLNLGYTVTYPQTFIVGLGFGLIRENQ